MSRKTVAIIGLLALVLMGLFPPTVVSVFDSLEPMRRERHALVDGGGIMEYSGYERREYRFVMQPSKWSEEGFTQHTAEVDSQRLLLQVVALISVLGLGLVLAKP